MAFDDLLSMDVTVAHKEQTGNVDGYNNPKVEVVSITTYKGYVEQANARGRAGATRERLGGFDIRTSDWIVILPKDAILGSLDEVTALGITFGVVGQPWPVHTPGGRHHIEANLREVEGA
jgi:hypothetical protein